MNAQHLVKMANEIAQNFEAEPDMAERDAAIFNHLRRFWDPRMRQAILAHLDTAKGDGLRPSVLQVLTARRGDLLS